VETLPGNELFARIYAVGKKFEQDPKAVHIHAEIENKKGTLIPGMYIRGQIMTDSIESNALPEGAIIRDGDKYYAFMAEMETEQDNLTWIFKPVEIRTGITENGWVAVTLLQEIPEETLFAMNNAYYLLAEMQKGEAEHSH
jgi:cobalt-zinc-cadmium efflux system membrane fusion protein